MKKNILLVDVDGGRFPNFALMKICAYHKMIGNNVIVHNDLFRNCYGDIDLCYASKVFTFSKEELYFPADCEVIKGGTGFDIHSQLPDEIETMLPDYSMYPQFEYAVGFLSRGCIRNCPWCIVPEKEGYLYQYSDIEKIASCGRRHVVLMDNNFLANDYEFVKEQLEKAQKLNLFIDFNQGLDARKVNELNAPLLANTKWKAATGNNSYIRFACDTMDMVKYLSEAILTLRSHKYNGEIFVYVLAKELDETLERLNKILAIDPKIHPFVQPYRDFHRNGEIQNHELKRLARWCNHAAIRKSCSFLEYKQK